jgi:gp16 family phage-associated protein
MNDPIRKRKATMKTKTIPEFKAELQLQGITAVEWAEKHNFPAWAVYRVMAGMNKGHRGRAHKIAVAMGVKPDLQQAA